MCCSRLPVFIISVLLAIYGVRQEVTADEPPQVAAPIDFATEIFPLLERSCLECHGDRKQEGGLRLDRRSEALQSGAIAPNSPETSEILRRINLPREHEEVMPALGEPLSKQQIEKFRLWVEQGAHWPESFERPRHWAYVAPQRPAVPQVEFQAWVQSPVDSFVLRKLEDAGLQPAPRAAPEKLVRRLFLDLIGLPPTPPEVALFAADPSLDNYERIVDQLLERPQFGERWARPWLDLARYADSHGFQRDDLRDNWAYRDWVIRALNEDMPFDRFTIEQIAGDLLPNATESQKVATGFHRCAPTNVEAGSLPEATRVAQVLDRVNTTGAIWLGTTLECCQCHDHKYDPFTMKDYYRLLAFFNNTELEADLTKPDSPSSIQFQGPSMQLAMPARDAQRAALESKLTAIATQQQEREKEIESRLAELASQLAGQSSQSAQLHVMTLSGFTSQGTTDAIEPLEDGSVLLVGGDPPDTDVYTAKARTQLEKIVAFRLDVLQHEQLPGKGPGRGDSVRRNFVLNNFSATLQSRSPTGENSTPQKLKFSTAEASFSQKRFDVKAAIDDSLQTGWAISPKFEQSHWATFALEDPIDLDDKTEVVFELTQSYGQARSIGCFRISAVTGSVSAQTLPGEILVAAAKPANDWTKVEKAKLTNHFISIDERSQELDQQTKELSNQIAELAADTTLVMVELDKPRVTNVFVRGDYKTPGEVVSPGTPSILHTLPNDELENKPNRLSLAKWLVSPENPLVARATVNRWWAEIFGLGLVPTLEDFGVKGDPPSHPELLDWLSVEFIDKHWSMKRLLKTIVMSSTYQQSSRTSPEMLARDDLNRDLARGPRLRLDAEMIRDNALCIAGLLDLEQYGPPIRPQQPDGVWSKVGGQNYNYVVSPGSQQNRRSIYVVLKRGAPYPSFINFDATARLSCIVRRSRTNTPLQALTLLNDPVYVAAADALAERVLIERSSSSLHDQIDYAFRLCVARAPTDSERATLVRLFEAQLAVERKSTQLESQAERIAWNSLATTLLNLHETITKD